MGDKEFMETKRGKDFSDRISQLPDEILVSILCLLSLKEAAGTSVLSRRWQHLWKYVDVLNFDGSNSFDDFDLRMWLHAVELYEARKSNYIGWVNQVLTSHRGSTLKEFRACFVLLQSSGCHIDRWLEIVSAKGVQRLELDLLQQSILGIHKSHQFYRFPSALVLGQGISYLENSNAVPHVKHPSGFSNFKSLTVLCLRSVHISSEVIQHLLLESPLETLRVVDSHSLTHLTIAGPSLQLKCLEISHCFGMWSLEISASSLVSFTYFGPAISIHIKDAPLLTEANFGSSKLGLSYAFHHLSSYFHQLEILTLRVHLNQDAKLPEIPKLTMLKRLVIRVMAQRHYSLLKFALLIEASPHLREFVLQLTSVSSSIETKVQKAAKSPHEHLKMVEMIGFVGYTNEIEIARYLLENAIMLEKIVINSCCPSSIGKPQEHLDSKKRQRARHRAKKLKRKLPPGAKLVIL